MSRKQRLFEINLVLGLFLPALFLNILHSLFVHNYRDVVVVVVVVDDDRARLIQSVVCCSGAMHLLLSFLVLANLWGRGRTEDRLPGATCLRELPMERLLYIKREFSHGNVITILNKKHK